MTRVTKFLAIIFLFTCNCAFAQQAVIVQNSVTRSKNPAFTKDTMVKVVGNDTLLLVPKHDPRKATMRSLIIPGWGQAYNHEYWKIPLVYGAIGTAAGFYVYNNSWYKRTKKAFEIKVNEDTARFSSIHPVLQTLSPQSLQVYRNGFRRNRDYSALYFILLWGLNVADATVFAHLREFDVNDDLSLKISPVLRSSSAGFSLVLGYRQKSVSKMPLY